MKNDYRVMVMGRAMVTVMRMAMANISYYYRSKGKRRDHHNSSKAHPLLMDNHRNLFKHIHNR